MFKAFYWPNKTYGLPVNDLRFTAMEVRTCHSSKGTRCSGCLQCFRHFITPHKVLKTTLCLEIIMPILQMKVRFREVKWLPSLHCLLVASAGLNSGWFDCKDLQPWWCCASHLLGGESPSQGYYITIMITIMASRAMPLFSKGQPHWYMTQMLDWLSFD